jgi:hypothetical protein
LTLAWSTSLTTAASGPRDASLRQGADHTRLIDMYRRLRPVGQIFLPCFAGFEPRMDAAVPGNVSGRPLPVALMLKTGGCPASEVGGPKTCHRQVVPSVCGHRDGARTDVDVFAPKHCQFPPAQHAKPRATRALDTADRWRRLGRAPRGQVSTGRSTIHAPVRQLGSISGQPSITPRLDPIFDPDGPTV